MVYIMYTDLIVEKQKRMKDVTVDRNRSVSFPPPDLLAESVPGGCAPLTLLLKKTMVSLSDLLVLVYLHSPGNSIVAIELAY